MARPPGKKRQPLAMLSGGERALTAVALLLAMLEVRPVPFCVLDEVDAALDEANVGALRRRRCASLAETTQFIVITHNRGTIEAADALYGVTIGDDAVSRVIRCVSTRRPSASPSSALTPYGGRRAPRPSDGRAGRRSRCRPREQAECRVACHRSPARATRERRRARTARRTNPSTRAWPRAAAGGLRGPAARPLGGIGRRGAGRRSRRR